MVSGFVTSPCDQLRIFSGEAREMRMASKSAITFAISNGLERNMFLRFLLSFSTQSPVASPEYHPFVPRDSRASNPRNVLIEIPKGCLRSPPGSDRLHSVLGTRSWGLPSLPP